MKVKFLRNGRFSITPVRGPVILCKKDMISNELREQDCEVLIQRKWAKKIVPDPKISEAAEKEVLEQEKAEKEKAEKEAVEKEKAEKEAVEKEKAEKKAKKEKAAK